MAQRWEDLAEFRHQQLLLEEAQMLQLQAFLGKSLGTGVTNRWVPDLPLTGLWIWSFRSAWKRAWMPLQSNTAATRNVFSILPKSGWGMNPWRRNWSPLNLDMRQSWRTSRTGKTQTVLEGAEPFQRDFFQILRFLRIHLHWNSWLWAQDLVRMKESRI